jgi:hypothetical protein
MSHFHIWLSSTAIILYNFNYESHSDFVFLFMALLTALYIYLKTVIFQLVSSYVQCVNLQPRNAKDYTCTTGWSFITNLDLTGCLPQNDIILDLSVEICSYILD